MRRCWVRHHRPPPNYVVSRWISKFCPTVPPLPFSAGHSNDLESHFHETRERASRYHAGETTASFPGLHHECLLISERTARASPPAPSLRWTDIRARPTASLQQYQSAVAAMLLPQDIHDTLVETTVESVLLPQHASVAGCVFILLRYAVPPQGETIDSIQDSTNRLSLFFLPRNAVLTVHRDHAPFIAEMLREWPTAEAETESAETDASAPDAEPRRVEISPSFSPHAFQTAEQLLHAVMKRVVQTYSAPLHRSETRLDLLEAAVFQPDWRQTVSRMKEVYHLKRRAAAYSRVLGITDDAYNGIVRAMGLSTSDAHYQDVLQDLKHARNLAEELGEKATGVMQIIFQISSYQLNEMMRVLTLFSALFIPLSVVASVFGMNFDYMPLIHDENGYRYCVAGMSLVLIGLLWWFRYKAFF